MSHDHSLNPETMPQEPEKATLEGKNKFLGLWFFLGGETVLFASLFGTYLALRNSTAGGPATTDLFGLELVFVMTMLLLTSSLTSVYAMYQMKNNNFKKMQLWLGITALLGMAFLACELYEFYHYIHEYECTFRSSAFGSAFYTLVGFHGGHVVFGLSWL
ncbi:cytochrome (ubi)quinol oxidase subunit III, partial [Halomonas sp. MG34]|nr:cytochrome (ubi)quinol oxidase subunit III [Halomonas sp. MG34]